MECYRLLSACLFYNEETGQEHINRLFEIFIALAPAGEGDVSYNKCVSALLVRMRNNRVRV